MVSRVGIGSRLGTSWRSGSDLGCGSGPECDLVVVGDGHIRLYPKRHLEIVINNLSDKTLKVDP